MAIVSDGITEVDLGLSNEKIIPGIDKSTKRTGGGNIRAITSGERFRMDVTCRISDTLYRTLLDLLLNGSNNYFFTPSDITEWTRLYPDINFPLNSDISSPTREWDKRNIYYVNFNVESVSYV